MGLYNEYNKFCEYRYNAESNYIDLSKEVFFKPTTLLPLYSYVIHNNVDLILPEDKGARDYLEIIRNRSLDNVSSATSTYLPFVRFPKNLSDVNRILDYLYQIQNIRDYGGENAFKYIVGEIVDNIYQHSEFHNAYSLAQAYSIMNYMDVCIIDDGITVNGCFQKNNITSYNDVEAVALATSGLSTKSRERGTGLESSIRIITEGLDGSFLIVSGNGALEFSQNQKRRIELDDSCRYEGTLVSIRIPYRTNIINIYDYIN